MAFSRSENKRVATNQALSPSVIWTEEHLVRFRWRSRAARIIGLQGTSPSQLGQRTEVISLPSSHGRTPSCHSHGSVRLAVLLRPGLLLPSARWPATADTLLCSFTPARAVRLPLHRWPASSR